MNTSEALSYIAELLERYDSTDNTQRKIDLIISALTTMRIVLEEMNPCPVTLTYYGPNKKEEIQFKHNKELIRYIDKAIQYALTCQKAKDLGISPELHLAPLKILLLQLINKRFSELEHYAKI